VLPIGGVLPSLWNVNRYDPPSEEIPMAKSIKNKKAIKKIEKAVKKAVRKGIAEEDVEQAVDEAISKAPKAEGKPSKRERNPIRVKVSNEKSANKVDDESDG
jgi:hypothetical protein